MSDERKAVFITLGILAALALGYLVFGPKALAIIIIGFPMVCIIYLVTLLVITNAY